MNQLKINAGGETKTVDILEVIREEKGIQIHCMIDGSRKLDIVKTVNGEWMEQSDESLKPTLFAELIGRKMDQLDNTVINDDTFLMRINYGGNDYKLTITPVKENYRVVHEGVFLFDVVPPDHVHSYWYSAPGSDADPGFVDAVGRAIRNY